MQLKKVLSLVMAWVLLLTTGLVGGFSYGDNKLIQKEDIEIIPVNGNYGKVWEGFGFSEGLILIGEKDVPDSYSIMSDNNKWGYMDVTGNLAIPMIYDGVESFKNGVAIVSQIQGSNYYDQKYGLIDKKGNILAPLKYESINMFKDGLAKVGYEENKKTRYGFIDTSGKVVVPIEYDYVDDFSGGLARVVKNKKVGYVNQKGEIVIPLIYEGNYGSYSDGLISVRKNGKSGYVDRTGKVVIPFDYDITHDFSEGYAVVGVGKLPTGIGARFTVKYGIIDKTGKIIVPIEYDYIGPVKNGIAEVNIGRDLERKEGFIDIKENILVPIVYDKVDAFSDGLAKVSIGYKSTFLAVHQEGKYGYVDKTGKVVIPIEYDYFTGDFIDGLAIVVKGTMQDKNQRRGVIDKTGKPIIPIEYSNIVRGEEGTFLVSKNVEYESTKIKKGLVNRLGQEILPLEYDYLTPLSQGLALGKKEGKWYLLRNKKYLSTKKTENEKSYIYNETDKGESLVLPTDELANVTDKATATEAVDKALAGATEEQKKSATGTDLLTLYGEEAALRASKAEVDGSEFIIDKAGVEKVENATIEAKTAVEGALKEGGVTVQRELSSCVIYEVKEGEKLSVKVDGSSAEAKADNVRVETPTYSLSFNKKALASIKEESAEPLEITVTELPAESAALPSLSGTHIPSKALGANILEDAVSKVFDIKFSKKIKEKIKLSLPVIKGNPKYQAVYDSTGKAIGGKYNPVTKKLDVKINKSDKYVVKEKKKSFADITSKSKEMQDAIEILASKGIIAGTSPTNFSPDGAITRAEIAALILRSISKLNPSENGGFSDVASTDWYFGAVGSAKRHGIMKGVSANLFAPKRSILKDQIVAVAARVLKEEMGYLAPAGPEAFLSTYTDAASIPAWAKSDVALATREGLVVKRYDSAFIPSGTMTRGDVAVILYRLFKKLW